MNTVNSETHVHSLPAGAKSCPDHPENPVVVYPGEIVVCLKSRVLASELPPLGETRDQLPVNGKGATSDKSATGDKGKDKEAKPQEKEEESFKRPDVIRADAEKEALDLRHQRLKTLRRWISDSLHRMISDGKTETTLETCVSRYLTSDDFAQLRDELANAGYTAMFLDHKTRENLIPAPVAATPRCECSGCHQDGGEMILGEFRRIKKWACDALKPTPAPSHSGYRDIYVSLSISKDQPVQGKDQSIKNQDQPVESKDQPVQGQSFPPLPRDEGWNGKNVLDLFLNMNMAFLLLVYALVPVVCPRIFQPFWGAFACFILVARFVRWNNNNNNQKQENTQIKRGHGCCNRP